MTVFVALRPKTCSYLMDDGNSDKKAKGTKKCVIKIIIKNNHYENCLFKNEIMLKSQQRVKSEAHNVFTEDCKYKRLQIFDRIGHIHMV